MIQSLLQHLSVECLRGTSDSNNFVSSSPHSYQLSLMILLVDERGKMTCPAQYLVRKTARFSIQPYPIPRHVNSSTTQIFNCSPPTLWLEQCARL